MDFLLYIICFGIIWLLSWLPLRVLYGLSDICFFFIWYIIPYRKKLVYHNLSQSFPEKSAAETKIIAKKFYRNFCDKFIESLAAVHMREKEHRKRYKLRNVGLIDDLYSAGKDVLLMSAHYGNWEWLSLLPLYTRFKIFAIYKILHNRYFDRLFSNLRSRYGVIAVPKEKTLRTLIEFRKSNPGIPMLTFLLGDQRPRWQEIQHWIRFMNQDTSVILGPEKIARKFNMAVVFIQHIKLRRGYYESVLIPITSDTASTNPLEITEKYYRILESVIKESPSEYLWTHNRWKHSWKKDSFKKPNDHQAIS
jgi:KDO2-lipid IV(A) lauroyltransferase